MRPRQHVAAGRRHRRPRAAVLALLATLALPLAPAAALQTPTPAAAAPAAALYAAPTPSAIPTTTGDADAVGDSERAVAGVEAELDAVSDAASQALEAYQAAQRQLSQARTVEVVQHLVAGDAQQSARSSRAAVSQWARWSYVHAGGAGELSAALVVLQDATPSTAASALATLRNVSAARSHDAERAVQVQRDAALDQARAESASASATAAATQAEALRVRSQQLLAVQRDHLALLQAVLAADRAALRHRQEQQRLAAEAERLREVAERERDRQAALLGVAATWGDEDGHGFAQRAPGALPAGACQGGDLSAYPNGQLPTSALCPLWSSPGQLLRADAAAAFVSLSHAFAADFGTPLCVTDSYRPLADQVRLAQTKPQLAARPGTSNHGWGVALDLCGGVQRFGSAQHGWMRQHAPLSGWFHPSWARADGSRPEPWHWEFAG